MRATRCTSPSGATAAAPRRSVRSGAGAELPAQVQGRVDGSDRDPAGNARQDRGVAGRGLFSLGTSASLRAGDRKRYWEFVADKVSLVHDVDDTRNREYGEYYTKRNPLTAAKCAKQSREYRTARVTRHEAEFCSQLTNNVYLRPLLSNLFRHPDSNTSARFIHKRVTQKGLRVPSSRGNGVISDVPCAP